MSSFFGNFIKYPGNLSVLR